MNSNLFEAGWKEADMLAKHFPVDESNLLVDINPAFGNLEEVKRRGRRIAAEMPSFKVTEDSREFDKSLKDEAAKVRVF